MNQTSPFLCSPLLVLVGLAAGACTTDNPSYCDEDKPCSDLAAPYCDLRGEFGPANTCTAAPEPDAAPAPDAISPDGGATYTLSVSLEGSGTVTSSPAGIDCGDVCAAEFAAGERVTLTATPASGYTFSAWSDDCTGVDPTCEVVVDGPVAASAQFAPIKAVGVAAGFSHSCAVFDNGAVRCWGAAHYGQLGYANTDAVGDDGPPSAAGDVDVGGSAGQVVAGALHTCALLNGGAVRCWGDNSAGQLGYSNTTNIGDNETPASAGDVSVGGTVTQLAAGAKHTCALLDTGAVRCWGDNSAGQLGYGNTNAIGDNETPASAGDVAVGGAVIQLAAGGAHTCALLDGGVVRCWGANTYGQLGYGHTNVIGDNETPASVGGVDVGADVTRLALGYAHSCARLGTGKARCWGINSVGQLGYGNTTDIGDDETPASVVVVDLISRSIVDLSLGLASTCAHLSGGHVQCWGIGDDGQLGYGNTDTIGDDERPYLLGTMDLGGPAEVITTGYIHACAVMLDGAVRCWGSGTSGKLGYGNTESIGDDETPATAGDVPVF